jgi:DnaJ-class molecular chaperone
VRGTVRGLGYGVPATGCSECEGTGLGAPYWIDRSGYHHPAEPCPCCHGTGIEPKQEAE